MSKKKEISKPNEKLGNVLIAKSLTRKKGNKINVLLMSNSDIEELRRTKRMPGSLKSAEPFVSRETPFFTHYHNFVKAKTLEDKENALTEMKKFLPKRLCFSPCIESSSRELQRLKALV